MTRERERDFINREKEVLTYIKTIKEAWWISLPIGVMDLPIIKPLIGSKICPVNLGQILLRSSSYGSFRDGGTSTRMRSKRRNIYAWQMHDFTDPSGNWSSLYWVTSTMGKKAVLIFLYFYFMILNGIWGSFAYKIKHILLHLIQEYPI